MKSFAISLRYIRRHIGLRRQHFVIAVHGTPDSSDGFCTPLTLASKHPFFALPMDTDIVLPCINSGRLQTRTKQVDVIIPVVDAFHLHVM